MSWIRNFSIVIFVTLLSLEAISFVITKFGLFLINETPSLYTTGVYSNYQDIAYGRTERDKWGAWHTPNGIFRHKKSCFDITMSFNEIGARDDSFHNVPSSSLFLLGDSFAEGFGVAREDMSEFLIEKELNLSILNFGASGTFGPLQELLIYDEYKELPHQGLIIYVLPGNDFKDNDAQYSMVDQTRYRPYFSSVGDALVPFYFPDAFPRDNFVVGLEGVLKQFIKTNFWFSNALRSALMISRSEAHHLSTLNEHTPSFYYDVNEIQQTNLILAYEAILNLANDKNVLFVIIPSTSDIKRYNEEQVPDSYQSNFWYQNFLNFQDRREQRVEILDLMDHLPNNPQSLFFECDSHWSAQGNLWAANIVSQFIKDMNLFEIE